MNDKNNKKNLNIYNFDVKTENRKMVGKLYVNQIIAVIISMIFYLTMTLLVSSVGSKKIGETIIQKNEDGSTSVVSKIVYAQTTTQTTTKATTASTVETKEGETTTTTTITTAPTLPSNQYIQEDRTEISKTVRVSTDIIFQIVMILILISLVYSPLWTLGDKDSNRIKFNRIKNDKYRGLRIGLFATIPLVFFNVVLVIAKIAKIDNYMLFYRILNSTFMPIINNITGLGVNKMASVSVFEIIILWILPIIIPIVAHLAYTLGLKHISISEKIIYVNQKKKRK